MMCPLANTEYPGARTLDFVLDLRSSVRKHRGLECLDHNRGIIAQQLLGRVVEAEACTNQGRFILRRHLRRRRAEELSVAQVLVDLAALGFGGVLVNPAGDPTGSIALIIGSNVLLIVVSWIALSLKN